MMKDEFQLSVREQSVMDLLWEGGEALTSVEIMERRNDIMQNVTYVHRTINSLLNAGFIQACGIARYRTKYARKFVPCMTREEYAAKYLFRHGIQAEMLGKVVVALLKETQGDEKTDTDKMIAQIQNIIDFLKEQTDDSEGQQEVHG